MLKYFLNDLSITNSKQYRPGRCRKNVDIFSTAINRDLECCTKSSKPYHSQEKRLDKAVHENIFELFAVNYNEKH